MDWRQWATDLWRGYTDADRESLEAKFAAATEVGEIIEITDAEYRCWRDGDYGGQIDGEV